MDPQIIAAVIGSVATIAAVVIGWWLQERKSRTSTSVGSKAIEADLQGSPPRMEEMSKTEADARSHNFHNLDTGPVTKLSQITVEEIVEAINSAPPFQKNRIAEQYNGIKVKWTGYLKEAKEDFRDEESVRVNLNVNRDTIIGHSFWFTEKLAKLPEIRTLKRESEICVVGEILSSSGDGLCVDLKPITVEVLGSFA